MLPDTQTAPAAVVPHKGGRSLPQPRRAPPLEIVLYWRSVWRRKWWIAGAALVGAALAGLGASYMTPMYRATVTLMIEQNRARLVSIEEVYSGVSPNREHYQTQAEMLKSPQISARVIERLELAKHPEFDPRQREAKMSLDALRFGTRDTPATEWTEERVESAVLAEFGRRIAIEPVRLTQLVKLTFSAADPQLAARIANAIAETYIEMDLEIRGTITQRAGDWLAERLSGLKGNLEESERHLQQYRERQGLLDTRGLAQGGAPRQIEELTRALNDATQRRVDSENSRRQIKSAQPDGALALPVILRTPAVDRLKRQESEAERNLAALSERYGPEHQRIVQARRQLADARANTQRGIEAVLASQSKEYESAVADERATARSLAGVRGAVLDINRKEFQLEALEQDVATNRQIYDRFLNRYRETRVSSDSQNSVARVVDAAVQPGSPYKPRQQQIILVGLMIGALLAAVTALLRDRIDTTVQSGEDIEERLALPTIAVLPLLTGNERATAGRHYLEQPRSTYSEAIRSARTSILLSAVDEPRKVLLVTSSLPEEGKSAFSLNLALAHAQTKKTILVEADLRRPSLARQLGLDPGKPGLTDLLAGKANFAECVQRVPGSSLYVLPAGPSPDNPLDLLSSEAFAELLERIAGATEMLILDSPPVHLVSDAVVLAPLVSEIIFVVKADSTPYPLAQRCIRTLQEAGGEVIGITLNQLDFAKASGYGGYIGYSKDYAAYQPKAT